jgi:hypothetical protein
VLEEQRLPNEGTEAARPRQPVAEGLDSPPSVNSQSRKEKPSRTAERYNSGSIGLRILRMAVANMSSEIGGNGKEPVFEVPIQALEEALGRTFRPADLEDIDIGFEECESLYAALNAYHQNNRIQPVATANTVRPNLSFVSLAQGVIVERALPPYAAGSYLPRNGEYEIPVDEITRTLLFADAVVIEDPIFAFCRAVLSRNWMEARPSFSLLEESLQQLARFRPLLEQRLLRLTAYFPDAVENFSADIPKMGKDGMAVRDVTAATNYRDARVLRLITEKVPDRAQVGSEEWRSFIRSVTDKEGSDFQWLYRQAESLVYGTVDPDAYCPHLPNDYQYAVFNKLLARNAKSADLDIGTMMELNSGCAADPAKINIDDLVRIRRDEQVFNEWRELVRVSVNAAQLRKEDGKGKLEVFKNEMKNRGRNWQSNFQKYNKGKLKDLMTVSKEVSVGGFKAAVAAGAGAAFDPTGISVLGGLFYGLYKSARNVEKAADRKAAEAAALSFLTVIRDTPPS